MATSDDTPRTIEIPLTKGYFAIVDAEDADLNQFGWYAHINKSGRVYARRSPSIDGHTCHLWMHKIIYARKMELLFAPDETVDHIDNNSLNNTRQNLRGATNIQNLRNAKQQARQAEKGILKGAHYHKRDQVWTSAIRIDGKPLHLGTFDTMEEAHEAYCKAAEKYYGEFARYE
jgi:hypothetical protein